MPVTGSTPMIYSVTTRLRSVARVEDVPDERECPVAFSQSAVR
jgi:hypothetical protein